MNRLNGLNFLCKSGPGSLDNSVLVGPNYYNRSVLTFSRANATSVATGLNSDSSTYSYYGADVPRFVGSSGALLLEGQRTNALVYPRNAGEWAASGAAISSGSLVVTPNVAAPDGSLTATRFTLTGGTPLDALALRANGSGLVNTSVYATTLYIKIVQAGYSGAVTLDASDGAAVDIQSSLIAGQWVKVFTLLTAGASASALDLQFADIAGTVLEFDIWGAQVELGGFSSSLVYPASGTGPITRPYDYLSGTLTKLGLPASGAGTILMEVTARHTGTPNATLFQMNATGAATTRYSSYLTAGDVKTVAETAGVGNTGTAGTHSASTTFAVGYAINGSGRIAASVDGAAAVAVTGGPTTGVTEFYLGTKNDGTEAAFAEFHRVKVLPIVLSDADLASAIANF